MELLYMIDCPCTKNRFYLMHLVKRMNVFYSMWRGYFRADIGLKFEPICCMLSWKYSLFIRCPMLLGYIGLSPLTEVSFSDGPGKWGGGATTIVCLLVMSMPLAQYNYAVPV